MTIQQCLAEHTGGEGTNTFLHAYHIVLKSNGPGVKIIVGQRDTPCRHLNKKS